MGTYVKTTVWEGTAGIRPPSDREAELLRAMSDAAFKLVKVIELEMSGIRDGDGYWHGSDVIGGVTKGLVTLIEKYLEHTSSLAADKEQLLPFEIEW